MDPYQVVDRLERENVSLFKALDILRRQNSLLLRSMDRMGELVATEHAPEARSIAYRVLEYAEAANATMLELARGAATDEDC